MSILKYLTENMLVDPFCKFRGFTPKEHLLAKEGPWSIEVKAEMIKMLDVY